MGGTIHPLPEKVNTDMAGVYRTLKMSNQRPMASWMAMMSRA